MDECIRDSAEFQSMSKPEQVLAKTMLKKTMRDDPEISEQQQDPIRNQIKFMLATMASGGGSNE